MKIDWKTEQQRLHSILAEDARCFVRICRTDDALWISDLPRHAAITEALTDHMAQQGFGCRLDEKSRMWHIDCTQQRWRKLLAPLPAEAVFPACERYHSAYALCRLWLSHPAELDEQSMPLLRRVAKLSAEPEERMLDAIPVLHETAAMHLRMGIPSAYGAGLLLADWLNERKEPEQ